MDWLLWLVIGMALGGGIAAVLYELAKREIEIRWYEGLLGFLALVALVLGIQTFIGSYAEYEPQAAWMSLLFTLLPAVVFVAAAARLVQTRRAKS
ncbi:MAG: dehalogenase [Anaerolineales bacterium]